MKTPNTCKCGECLKWSDIAGMCEECRYKAIVDIRPKHGANTSAGDKDAKNLSRWTSHNTQNAGSTFGG